MEERKTPHATFQKADIIVKRAVKYYSYIAVATILIMGFIASADVVTSKFFGFAIPITNDLVKWLIIPTCFCLLAEVHLNSGLMQVDLFSRKYGPKARRVLNIITAILGMSIFGYAGRRITVQMLKYFRSHEMSSMSSHALPLWPFALVCVVSIFLLVFSFLWSVLRDFFLPPAAN